MIIIIVLLICFDEIQSHYSEHGYHEKDNVRLTIKGRACVFPFSYEGLEYTDCTPGVGQPYPWCAISTKDDSANTMKDWDVCAKVKRVDGKICKDLDQDNCQSKRIKKLCPQMCLEDGAICKSLDRDNCQSQDIKNLCPQMCTAGVDGEICKDLDQDNCQSNRIEKLCPQICLEEIDGAICKSLDRDNCRSQDIKNLCPQLCTAGLSSKLECSASSGFFRAPGSSQCFKIFPDQTLDWEEADAKCKSEGLALVKPTNPVALRKYLVDNYVNLRNSYWMGARSDGSSYKWQRDGTELSSTSSLWRSGNPGTNFANKYCLYMEAHENLMRIYPGSPYGVGYCTYRRATTLCEVVI